MFNIAIILMLINIFRMPIVATLEIYQFSFIFHSFLFISFLFLKDWKTKLQAPRAIYISWSLLAALSFVILFNIDVPKNLLKSQVLPFVVPAFFPLFLNILNIEKEKLLSFFYKLCTYIFYLGSFWFIGEYFFVHILKIVSQCDFASWLHGQENIQYCQTSRKMPVGFIIYKDISLSLLIGCYFLFKNIRLRNQIFNTVLILLNLVIVDSLTLFFTFFVILSLKHYNYIKNNFWKALILVLFSLNLFTFTNSFKRIFDYIFSDLDLSSFLPIYSEPKWENIFYTAQGINEQWNSQEFHSLYYLFQYGFFATLPWYLFWIISLVLAIKEIKKHQKLTSFLIFNMVLVFSGLHYSGAEAWGINLIFCALTFLAIENLYKEKQESIA